MSFKVVMTTRNRLDLLAGTVDSLVEYGHPEGVEIFDDCSDDPAQVKKIVSKLSSPVFHENKTRLGCDFNTPVSVGKTFEAYPDVEHILILDSDVLVSEGWMDHVRRCVFTMRQDKAVAAIQVLNLDNIRGKSPCDKYSDLLECKTMTACGLIVSRDYWKTFIVPQEKKHYWRWDMASAEMAYSVGMKLYCLKDSAIQHTGDMNGTHSGAGQVASFYKANTRRIPPGRDSMESVLVYPGAGYRNLAVSMIVAHILVKRGARVRVFHHDENWAAFITAASRGAFRPLHRPYLFQPRKDGRFNLPEKHLFDQIATYTPFNMEVDSDVNRWLLHSVDNNMDAFVRLRLYQKFGLKVEEEIDWSILQIQNLLPCDISRFGDGALLVNDIEGEAEKIEREPSLGSGRKIRLVHERPNIGHREIAAKYVHARNPMAAVAAIKAFGGFYSTCSQSAWVSLFCDVPRFVFVFDDWNRVPLPKSKEESSVYLQKSLPSVALVLESESSPVPPHVPEGVKVVRRSANAVGVEWIIDLKDGLTGFYPGWISDLIGDGKNAAYALVDGVVPPLRGELFLCAAGSVESPKNERRYSPSTCRLVAKK